MINSVLSSIPVHTLSCMVIPRSVTRRIENCIKIFSGGESRPTRAALGFSAALPLDERVQHRGVVLASKCSCCRQGIGIHFRYRPMRRGKWLAWTIPPTGILKMNTNGSKIGENAAGGGVIGEDKEVIHAELQVVLDGLIYLQSMEIMNVIIETDSAVASHMIHRSYHE